MGCMPLESLHPFEYSIYYTDASLGALRDVISALEKGYTTCRFGNESFYFACSNNKRQGVPHKARAQKPALWTAWVCLKFALMEQIGKPRLEAANSSQVGC